LVDAILRKDRKATADLVGLHADAIYNYVRRRLMPRADLVDDIVQEVFLTAWEKVSSFRAESSLRAWLLGIARHKVEDYYRVRLREAVPLSDDYGVELTDEPELDNILDRARLHSKTQSVMAMLAEPYRIVLLWRYWENRSTQQIAAQIGKTEKAVERMLARARDQFRRRWSNV
jgi:RNA polymerase sigma-70 factor (ECF subfamily)